MFQRNSILFSLAFCLWQFLKHNRSLCLYFISAICQHFTCRYKDRSGYKKDWIVNVFNFVRPVVNCNCWQKNGIKWHITLTCLNKRVLCFNCFVCIFALVQNWMIYPFNNDLIFCNMYGLFSNCWHSWLTCYEKTHEGALFRRLFPWKLWLCITF